MMERTLRVLSARESRITTAMSVIELELANDPRPISELPIRIELSVPYEDRERYRLGARVKIAIDPDIT